MENVKDIDGNSYKTVKIGEQIWMAENLKVNRYRNGDKIPTGYTRKDWYELKTGAYTFNDDNPANFGIYGNLYNWYAVDDHRGLSPEGWHIPTDDEWRKLEQYLGMKIEIMPWFRGSDEGSKLAGNQDLWENGDLKHYFEFGISGFNALPGGYYPMDPNHPTLGKMACFWTSTESTDSTATDVKVYAIPRSIIKGTRIVHRLPFNKEYGYSVRCIKD